MPELPEVNTVRKGFHSAVLHDTIMQVEVHDDHIFRNCSGNEFSNHLTGKSFTDTYRQGKYFFAALDDGWHVLFHLGMTGDMIYYHDEAERPRHERFSITFRSGLIMGYDDPRKFSKIRLLEDRDDYLRGIKLGPDALLITVEEFIAIFKGRSAPLKAVLMNQNLVAGIGNLYADEICYQAKIHPGSISGSLNSNHLLELYKRMKDILTTACERDAYYKVYPEDWFWKWRRKDVENIEGKGAVKTMKIGGRTTYFIEGYQKLIK